MRKDVKEYIKECQICQQERTFRGTDIKYKIRRSPEV